MAEVVLVVLRRPEQATGLLDAASCLAALVGEARIQALTVREPIHVGALAAEALMDEADSVLEAKQREGLRIADLKARFDRWAAAADGGRPAGHWVQAEGNAPAIIGEYGSRADIIVAGQPAEDDRPGRQAFRAALFGTDRPVLMVPPRSITPFGRCVAIAWRNEKTAVRAVIPALRCLAAAERVHVLVGLRGRSEQPEIPAILMEHSIRAELHVLPIGGRPFGEALLDMAHRLSADLLVMGAYAHSPLRELILGGVTQHMLDHADLPVFMRH